MPNRLATDRTSETEGVSNASAASSLPVSPHPMVITTALAGIVWSTLASWMVFLFVKASPAELMVLTAITAITSIPAAAVIGLSWYRYGHYAAHADAARVTRRPRDFRDFLNSEMEIATGRITGKDAYGFAIAMGLACAVFGTGTAIGLGIG